VSDLKGWQNEATKLNGIQAVSQNYLIGPDGKIVGGGYGDGRVGRVFERGIVAV